MSKQFTVEIITTSQPEASFEKAHGWGDEAVATRLSGGGHIKDVTIARDGRPVLGFTIRDDGTITLINCDGMFEILLGQSVTLSNTRPWKSKSP